MTIKINLDELGGALSNMITDYSKEVIDEINNQTELSGKELLMRTKEKAPVKTGAYKRAISVKHKKNGLVGSVSTVYVKAPHYRLPHLLERPHALRNGGLSKAQPHFGPAAAEVQPVYISNLKRAIEGVE